MITTFKAIWILLSISCVITKSILGGEPTNVVFILIDDLGYSDVGFMGSQIYKTPNIDRLASEGIVFTDAYSAGPNCAPARACLMSGQYSPRHGIYTVNNSDRGKSEFRRLIPIENQMVLPSKIVTLAELFRSAGYGTGHFGKWHLGSPPDSGPKSQGFDVNVGGNQTGSPAGGHFSPYQNPQLANPPEREYLTDRLTQEVITFLREHQNQPFFVYLSHYAVHTPIQAKQTITKKYSKAANEKGFNAKYAAMIESVDESVGDILRELDALQLADNTMVVFFSDNGGHGKITSCAPLRGSKGTLYEGGIRVPLAIRWPGTIPPGTRNDTPVCGIDFFPTVVELTGADPPPEQPLDGASLLPLLRGETTISPPAIVARDALYWHFPAYLQGQNYLGARDADFRTRPCSVIRNENWKLIQYFEDDSVELFDLSEDIGESNELSSKHPEVARRLLDKLTAWQDSIGAPRPNRQNPDYVGQR